MADNFFLSLTPQMALDGILIALLTVVLFYCVRLSRLLRVLRKDRTELAAWLRNFDSATQRAENAIRRLRTVSEQETHALRKAVAEARRLSAKIPSPAPSGSPSGIGVPSSGAGRTAGRAPSSGETRSGGAATRPSGVSALGNTLAGAHFSSPPASNDTETKRARRQASEIAPAALSSAGSENSLRETEQDASAESERQKLLKTIQNVR